eukprot:TRINITY_DN983_c0_g1_i2.p1 TRINITY_DN983_c0_g1~~TRINITY_DN983_c0_g1_i2.p1  ORF type:complete len:162 (-),score=56.22 TRINITY_DN983_c0_g1_i2:271-756(-)
MIRRPPRSTQSRSSAASDVYKRQGHKERNGFHRAALASHFYKLTGFERPKNQEHHTSCEVRERTLQRETDGKASSTHNSNKARGFNPKLAKKRDTGKDDDGIFAKACQKGADGVVDLLAFFKQLLEPTLNKACKPQTNQQYKKSTQKRKPDVDAICQHHVK